MSDLSMITTGNRTATVLLDAQARARLPQDLPWSLELDGAGTVATGVAQMTVLFLDGLKPLGAYIFHCAGQTLRFVTDTCSGLVDATDHGVSADLPDNSAAFAKAIAAVPEGGTLRVPAGRFLTGPVFLKSRMTLLLEDGATIAALSDRDGWPQLPARDGAGRVLGTWEGLPDRCFAAPVTAIDCTDLTITGRGVIDGGGDRGDWWTWPKDTRDGARRPRTLHLAYCTDCVLSGITVCNSPSWTIHPYRCDGLQVAALRVRNPADSPNTDGLNPESCRDVDIAGVSFSVGDDCIAIKAGKRGAGQHDHLAPCEDITIRHCEMQFGHGAVVLGSEMSGDIRRVTVSHCDFTRTDRGLRLKTRRGRGGTISDVVMRHVHMTGVATPFAANAFYFCDPDGKSDRVQSRTPAAVDDTTPYIHNIRLEHVTATGVTLAAAALLGLPEAPITDVVMSDVTVSYDPAAKSGVPLMALGVAPVRHGGVIAEFATVTGDITLPAKETPPPC